MANRPEWIDARKYPFDRNDFTTEYGSMHYIDEGRGQPLLFLHGNPTWSFLYRRWIVALSDSYRCIAPDYLGFGLSDKPHPFSYLPEDHAILITQFIRHLNLSDIVLVLHDWGGPIGLWFAVHSPADVSSLILMNTWMWPLNGQLRFELFSRGFGGSPGKQIIQQYNILTRHLMRFGVGVPANFHPDDHQHYIEPLRPPGAGKGCWVFPRALRTSRKWLSDLWDQRGKLARLPAFICWGMRDVMFRISGLRMWKNILHNPRVKTLERCGHFVPEEIDSRIFPEIKNFLATQ
ncbi:MAG TPA: alpha/beta fold hydrolase [bacterium]|nr:alpha/beta fold hydrolase [bacterium]